MCQDNIRLASTCTDEHEFYFFHKHYHRVSLLHILPLFEITDQPNGYVLFVLHWWTVLYAVCLVHDSRAEVKDHYERWLLSYDQPTSFELVSTTSRSSISLHQRPLNYSLIKCEEEAWNLWIGLPSTPDLFHSHRAKKYVSPVTSQSRAGRIIMLHKSFDGEILKYEFWAGTGT